MAVKKKAKAVANKKSVAKSSSAKKPAAKKAAVKKTVAKKAVAKKAAKPAKSASAKKVAPIAKQKTVTAKKTNSANWETLISPLEDRLVVAPEGRSTTTAGGLFIPDTAIVDRPFRGKVLAKGPGRRNKKGNLRPLDVKVGDEVMFAEWSGTTLQVEGQDVLILREEEVLGIVT